MRWGKKKPLISLGRKKRRPLFGHDRKKAPGHMALVSVVSVFIVIFGVVFALWYLHPGLYSGLCSVRGGKIVEMDKTLGMELFCISIEDTTTDAGEVCSGPLQEHIRRCEGVCLGEREDYPLPPPPPGIPQDLFGAEMEPVGFCSDGLSIMGSWRN